MRDGHWFHMLTFSWSRERKAPFGRGATVPDLGA
jgi:hypothetical protein